ncbi:hypothetical protein E3U43_012149 [Larimichthys crocea]|uniref:Uncharacterized protein n=1 Tax=Larimichthys crocea TaxID=215358 RepID=A0ACD3RQY2_LARCR|nr:hypothetical protein E3U43_012149 [Larimichthys crocea]
MDEFTSRVSSGRLTAVPPVLARMERWCVSRCLALLCPVSIHPLSMESAVLSVSIMKMAGPHGLSGPTVRSPVDVEGIKGDDPAMASSHPVLARRSKPAAA